MPDVSRAVLQSWAFDPAVIVLLVLIAVIYIRGWRRQQQVYPDPLATKRLIAFLSGLATLFIAEQSPLDTLGAFSLSAHMTQHMLLLMVAPPLLLIGQPLLPFVRGLPPSFLREAVAPFLAWSFLKRVGAVLVSPPFAWLAFAISTLAWHLPGPYERALRSSSWHAAEHACFFWTAVLFWWPVIQPAPSRSHWPRWVMIPYLLAGDMVNTLLSAALVFSGRVLYPSYLTTQLGSFSALDDQSTAGVIMWVPGSIVFLVPAVFLAMRALAPARSVNSRQPHIRPVPPDTRPFDLLRVPVIGAILRWRHLRRFMQCVMLIAAAAVIADGFTGSSVAPLNLAAVLPWIHWRAFVVISLLALGNVFCFACPFMLPRDLMRRWLPPRFRWPVWLRSKWLAMALFVAYLWTYEAFSAWNRPRLTAWIIVGYFLTALIVDALFRGASFCKYVCPIGQFNFTFSTVSPFEVKVRSLPTCRSCSTYDCIRGNTNQRGCQTGLFQPLKSGNLDCTFCLDCVHACPHDNIGLLRIFPAQDLTRDPRRSAIGRLSKRLDIAFLALALVFGAFANAALMLDPVMMSLPRGALAISLELLLAVVILPAALVAIAAAISRATAQAPFRELFCRFALAFIPVGLAMWAAHLTFHLATVWLALLPSVVSMQILLLDAGLLLSLYVAWRIARQYPRRLHVFLPWAVTFVALYGAGIYALFQPMQMRGVMVN